MYFGSLFQNVLKSLWTSIIFLYSCNITRNMPNFLNLYTTQWEFNLGILVRNYWCTEILNTTNWLLWVKFRFFEEATNIWKKSLLLISKCQNKWDIFSNFVAFLKYPNFTPPVNIKESPGNRIQPNILKTNGTGTETGTGTHNCGYPISTLVKVYWARLVNLTIQANAL